MFLRNFEVSFHTKTGKRVFENNEWITIEMKTSCKNKQGLYLNCQASNNQIKIHYRKYFKTLTQVIKEANLSNTINGFRVR
jgi:hypothetical protein